jgi:hypothetical protein
MAKGIKKILKKWLLGVQVASLLIENLLRRRKDTKKI